MSLLPWLPIKQTFQKMQRIVRDTATALGKKIQLQLEGEETSSNKTVLDAVSDPLVHLVRNAVGPRNRKRREACGGRQAREGNVILRAFHQAGKLLIEVADDGGGINPEIPAQESSREGHPLGRPADQRSRRDSPDLPPGFSTKQVVTDVSGRGVGMDVVKTNIEALQGKCC